MSRAHSLEQLKRWLGLVPSKGRKRVCQPRPWARWQVEELEERCLPSATLVRDINTNTLDAITPPFPGFTHQAEVDGTLYFLADDGVHGLELWKSDGTQDGTVLVKDIRPGKPGSVPPSGVAPYVTSFGGSVYLVANDGVHGAELWKSDGTEDGTVMVKDIRAGEGSYPQTLIAVGSTLFFEADNGTSGSELWKTDGTADGTVLVKDIIPGRDSGGFNSAAELDEKVYFFAAASTSARGLWVSDGTAAGTSLVKDFASAGFTSAQLLQNVNGVLYFIAPNETSGTGFQIWKSDGTTDGTVRVASRPGTFIQAKPFFNEVNGNLFFAATESGNDFELWKTDGTDAGTQRVLDIWPGPIGSVPRSFINFNNTLYFAAFSPGLGLEFWQSDGTPEGTVLVKDISPGIDSGFPEPFVIYHDSLYFGAANNQSGGGGRELWTSDGTRDGTVRVKDIRPGGAGSQPTQLQVVGDTLFFNAITDAFGRELWKSDGTEAGTVLVRDINTNTFGSNPTNFTPVGDVLYFTAGATNWKTDGTPAGTSELVPFPLIGSAQLGETFFFSRSASGAGTELWKSDGTLAGTVQVKDIAPGPASSNPGNFTRSSSVVFFTATDGITGPELWMTDGSESGTVLVKDIRTGAGGSSPAQLRDVNGTLFFVAFEPSTGSELWKSDGTTDGTFLVLDLTPGTASSALSNLIAGGNLLFFTRRNTSGNWELWRSDGSSTGTFAVRTFGTALPANFVAGEGVIYFTATTPAAGVELWISDGTETGTRMVKDIRSGSAGSNPTLLTPVGYLLYFAATTADWGTELWITDGTDSGTVLVKDITPGPVGSALSNLVNLAGTLTFTVTTPGTGALTLWWSNGTTDGTVATRLLSPFMTNPAPRFFTAVGSKLFFTADDGIHGVEPWVVMPSLALVIDDPATPGADVIIVDNSPVGTPTPMGNSTHLDLDASLGAIMYIGPAGNFPDTMITALSKPLFTNQLLLNASVISGSAGTLNLWATDTDFPGTAGANTVSGLIEGSTSGQVTFTESVDKANRQFPPADSSVQQLILGPFSGAFSDAGVISFNLTAPSSYSLTKHVRIENTEPGQFSDFASYGRVTTDPAIVRIPRRASRFEAGMDAVFADPLGQGLGGSMPFVASPPADRPALSAGPVEADDRTCLLLPVTDREELTGLELARMPTFSLDLCLDADKTDLFDLLPLVMDADRDAYFTEIGKRWR